MPENYALIIPGCSANNPQKRFPAERYRQITEYLGKKSIKSVVIGTNGEINEITKITQNNPYTINFINKTDITDIPDLARNSVITVGNDTGPSHIAAVAGAKTVMLFSEFDKRNARNIPNVINISNTTVNDITTNEVISAVDTLLNQTK